MNQVQEVTKKLILAIEESPEYIRYQKAKTELNKYPILKAKADEFRKCNYEIQNSHRDIFEEADKLQQEYAEVLDNSFVREYLTAENAFCRVLQQINWQLIETLDFEADFENTSIQHME
ncbi:MAG: YlbF family regulator [Lachnospiraceae bacterium]|nr:YlbF family regulator [Lachnospiraceae bacterium]